MQILINGNAVKIPHNLAAHLLEGQIVHGFFGYKILTLPDPFPVQCVDRSRLFFIGAHPIDAAHENIPEEGAVCGADQKACV